MQVKTSRRASSLPLLFDCPASAHGTLNVGSATHEAARAGSAVHVALTSIVRRVEPDLDALARRFDVERDEMGRLAWYGRKAWRELEPSFPNPETEVQVCAVFGEIIAIPGHVDLRSRNGSVTHMADWKSGRLDRNYYHQFIAYAAGEFFENEECEEVVFAGVWLRDQEIETYRFTREDVELWGQELLLALNSPNDFRVGPECEWCPRSTDCPALMALVRRDVEMFSGEEAGALLQGATSDQLIEIRRRAKLVSAFAESAVDLIKAHIRQSGPIRGSDGTILDLVPEAGHRVVNTLLAWPVLQEKLTDEEIASCVKVSIGAAESAVAEKAGRGDKGRAKKALGDALNLAGAITQGTAFKLKEIRKPIKSKEISK